MRIELRTRIQWSLLLVVSVALVVGVGHASKQGGNSKGSYILTKANRHSLSMRLVDACANADKDKVLSLLSKGANPNARDESGMPVIFEALRNSDTILQALVTYGADINIRKPESRSTPLMYAAAFLEGKTIRSLLAQGAKIDLQDATGDTALSRAAYNCGNCGCASNADTGRELIKGGADVNMKDWQGNTPLMILSEQPDAESVELAKALITRGAKVELKNKRGQTALQIALSCSVKDENTAALIRLLKAATKATQ